MQLLPYSVLIATAFAASVPSLSSTIVSTVDCTDCETEATNVALAPSSFAYSNSSTTNVAKVPAASDTEEASTIYDIATDFVDDVNKVVQTICDSYSNCIVTTNLDAATTMTTTVDGIKTVLTSGVLPNTESFNLALPTDALDDVNTTTVSEVKEMDETITVTKTTCDDTCYVTVCEEKLTSYTTTVDDVETFITTYCPVSESDVTPTPEAKEVTDISTAVVTVTSCKEDKCHEEVKTTGVTTVTDEHTSYTTYCPLTTTEEKEPSMTLTTVVDKDTSYTTYCPVTTTHEKEPSMTLTTVVDEKTSYTTYCPVSETSEEKEPSMTLTTVVDEKTSYTTYCPVSETSEEKETTSKPEPKPTTEQTVNVITDSIKTETPEPQTTFSTTSSASTPPPVSFETYEGSAAVLTSTGLLSLALSFFMII